jgi:hypothetical protein
MSLMRSCTKCFLQKPIEEFPWKSKLLGKRHGVCKECMAKRSNEWYQDNKEWHIQNVTEHRLADRERAQKFVLEYLSTHPCVGPDGKGCPYNETDPQVLEFDHVRGKKRGHVATLVRNGATIARLQEEISLCEVRCANCHRRKTVKEKGWFKWRQ